MRRGPDDGRRVRLRFLPALRALTKTVGRGIWINLINVFNQLNLICGEARAARSRVSFLPSRSLMLALLLAGAAPLADPGRVHASHFNVYVITGQSNSLGTTAGGEADTTPGEQPADAAVRFYWANVSTASSDPDNVVLLGRSGILTHLRVQQGDGGLNRSFWGPEFGLGRRLAEAGHENVLVIKASRGAGGNSFWIKDSGHMYGHVVETVGRATELLTGEGHTFGIRALLYLQGESDSAAAASVADARLQDLVNHLRRDLPNAADMHAIVGGIAADGATRDVVRDRQRLLAARDATVTYFSNLDFRSHLYDNLHFDRSAKLQIGARFADTVLALRGEAPIVENISFEEVTANEPATGIVFEDYVPDQDGAANGVVLQTEGVFRGFVDGRGGQPRIGLLVEGADGVVVFADYRGSVATADIAVGPFGDPAFPDCGRSVTLTFVDPDAPESPATVSRVGLRVGATSQADKVTVAFFDTSGRALHTTATVPHVALSDAQGFVARRAAGVAASEGSLIHRVRLTTNGPNGELWALGSFDDQSARTIDLAFAGFQTLGARQLPGDANQDSALDVSDAVAVFLLLFEGGVALPCAGGLQEGGNRGLLDVNGSGRVDLSDGVYLLLYLFASGPPPAAGVACRRIEGCPDLCGVSS